MVTLEFSNRRSRRRIHNARRPDLAIAERRKDALHRGNTRRWGNGGADQFCDGIIAGCGNSLWRRPGARRRTRGCHDWEHQAVFKGLRLWRRIGDKWSEMSVRLQKKRVDDNDEARCSSAKYRQ